MAPFLVSYFQLKFCYFFELVFKPKIVYKGQKLTILVNKKTPPTTSKTMPAVPSMLLVI